MRISDWSSDVCSSDLARSGANTITGGHLMTWIIAIIMGGIIGWLASIVMRTDAQQGIFINIIVGCIGSILARLLFRIVPAGGHLRGAAFDTTTFPPAFLAAALPSGPASLHRRGRASVRPVAMQLTEVGSGEGA